MDKVPEVLHYLSEASSLLRQISESERSVLLKKEEETKKLDEIKKDLEEKLKQANSESTNHLKREKELENRLKNVETSLEKIKTEKKAMEDHLLNLNSVLRSCLNPDCSVLNESDSSSDETVHITSRTSEALSSILDTEMLHAEFVRSALIDLLTSVETLTKEKQDLMNSLKNAGSSTENLKDTISDLKEKVKVLEIDLDRAEKDNKSLRRKVEESSSNVLRLEEALDKTVDEKKSLLIRLDNMDLMINKIEKEKRKYLNELNSIKTVKIVTEKDFIETKERLESRIKKLEASKDASDAQIKSLMKNVNQLTEEKESLLHELKMQNEKLIGLQNCNYKLHTALNESFQLLEMANEVH